MVEEELPATCRSITCSVVVQTLAGLLGVAVAPVCTREPGLGQVLPVEGPAAQLLALGLAPGPLKSQQVDVARWRNPPDSWMPG